MRQNIQPYFFYHSFLSHLRTGSSYSFRHRYASNIFPQYTPKATGQAC